MANFWNGAFIVAGALIAALATVLSQLMIGRRELAADSRQQARRLKFVRASLLADLATIAGRANQIPGIVKVHKAANTEVSDRTKQRCTISMPKQFDEWESMAVLPNEVLEDCITLMRLIDSNNYDIQRAGGAFGDDNSGLRISNQAIEIAERAHAISGKLRSRQPQEVPKN